MGRFHAGRYAAKTHWNSLQDNGRRIDDGCKHHSGFLDCESVCFGAQVR